MLACRDVTVRFGGLTAVSGLSFELNAGQWLMLVGPNGAGKSTLIRAVAQAVPYTGSIRWEGRDLREMSSRDRARRIGVLAQSHMAAYDYTVEEVVSLGRYAHRRGFLNGGDSEGEEKIGQALRLTGMEAFRGAGMLTLSGGETQRAFLAQVFAQDPDVLLLDEPANHLDLKYQQQLFSLIGDWLRQPGRAVLSVVHDLSLARRFGTHAMLLDHGNCAAQGPMDAVLTRENLRRVYEMDVYAWMQGLLSQWE